MESLTFRPERAQKTLWTITWIVIFVIGILSFLALLITAGPLVFGLCILAWLIIMIPIIIWIPIAFRALEYYIDSEGVKMKGGVIWRKYVTVPYSKITNVDVTQGPLQRYCNIGTIHIQTAGAGGQQGAKAELKLTGIRKLEEIRDIIIKNVKSISYLYSNNKKPGKEIIADGKSPVLESMLEELKAIRKGLEKKG